MASKDHESAFCNACFRQENHFLIVLKYLNLFLEQLSDNALLTLSTKFFETAIMLVKRNSKKTTLTDLRFLLKSHPAKQEELLASTSETLRENFTVYTHASAASDWTLKTLTLESLLHYKQIIQQLGMDALNLTTLVSTKIYIAKILLSDNPLHFWHTLNKKDRTMLSALMVLDFKQSKARAAKKDFLDAHLIFSDAERALLCEELDFTLALVLLRSVKLTGFNPENVAKYVDLILSFPSTGEESETTSHECGTTSAEDSSVLRLTYDRKPESAFFTLIRNDHPQAFHCLDNGRPLLVRLMENPDNYDFESLEPTVKKRLAHLCSRHKIEIIPNAFKEYYDAVELMYGYINKPKKKKAAPETTEAVAKDKEVPKDKEEATSAATPEPIVQNNNNQSETITITEAPTPEKSEPEKAEPVKPEIPEELFFKLFEISGFFFDLLFLNTNSNAVKLILIEHVLNILNKGFQINRKARAKFTTLVADFFMDGTPEEIGKLLALFSGENHHLVSSFICFFNEKDFLGIKKVTAQEVSLVIASQYFVCLTILNSLLFHTPLLIDKYISSAKLANARIEYCRGSCQTLAGILLKDIGLIQTLLLLSLSTANKLFGSELNRLLRLLLKGGLSNIESMDLAQIVLNPPDTGTNYQALFAEIVGKVAQYAEAHPEVRHKTSFAWLTLMDTPWYKAKVAAYHKLVRTLYSLEGMYEDFLSSDEHLLQIIELLKETGVDLETFNLLKKTLGSTLLWQAILLVLHRKQDIIIFEDATTELNKPENLPHNRDYHLECRFYTIAESTIESEQSKISSDALLKIVDAHGDKIFPLLDRYNLTTRYHRNKNLSATLSATNKKENKLETQRINPDEIIQGLLRNFRILVDTCPDADLTHSALAQTFFEDMVRTSKEINAPQLKPLLDTYPHEDKKNLLLWVTNCALAGDEVAKAKLVEWKNNRNAGLQLGAVMGTVCKSLPELKALLQFDNIRELSDSLINGLLNNDALFGLVITEFLDNLKDLIEPKGQLTQSNRDKIWAYLLKHEGTNNLLVQKCLADIKNPANNLCAVMFFTPLLYSLPLCEAYARENNLVDAEYWLIRAKITFAGEPVLSDEIRQLNEWMTLPDHYQHVRAEFSRTYAIAPDAETKKTLAEQYKANYIVLTEKHQQLMQQHTQVATAISKLRDHTTDLQTKKFNCSSQKDKDKYTHRIQAVNHLANDLETLSRNYYSRDFSALESNDNEFHAALSHKIEEHLAPKDSILKEHTGSKQVVYDILAGLTWILLPFSIYKAITHKTLFYFHAQNTTEEVLDEKIKPQLREAISHHLQ